MAEQDSVAAIILAAGYGSRISRDLHADRQFSHLASTPKPLLPLCGKPLLSHWLPHLHSINNVPGVRLSSITLVTNALHYPLYSEWAHSADQLRGDGQRLPSVQVLNDGTESNDTRLGRTCLEAIKRIRFSDDSDCHSSRHFTTRCELRF